MATLLERVRALIERLSPEQICDECIAQKLDLTGRRDANHTTRELAGATGFERRKGMCAICCGDKIVIRKR